jgi:NAD/NADP transhydrogenase beta subunit
VLDDSVIDIGLRHVPAIYVMQDLSSLIGLAAVLVMVCYALRRGQEPPVANRLVARAERIEWILAYTVAAIAFSVALYLWTRWGHPSALRSTIGRVSSVAIASLRGLTAALFSVSLVLQLRLRALRHRSSGPER